MQNLDLVQALGNATCVRSLFGAEACTMVESWNFGALIIVASLVVLGIAYLRVRSNQRRENNYYW